MTPVELTGNDYIVYFDDTEELNYQLCNQLVRELHNRFPAKNFIGMLRGIDFEELSDEDLKSLIQKLQSIQEQRTDKELSPQVTA